MAVSFAAARASSIAALSFGSRAYLFVSGANVKFGSRMIDLYNMGVSASMVDGLEWVRMR